MEAWINPQHKSGFGNRSKGGPNSLLRCQSRRLFSNPITIGVGHQTELFPNEVIHTPRIISCPRKFRSLFYPLNFQMCHFVLMYFKNVLLSIQCVSGYVFYSCVFPKHFSLLSDVFPEHFSLLYDVFPDVYFLSSRFP